MRVSGRDVGDLFLRQDRRENKHSFAFDFDYQRHASMKCIFRIWQMMRIKDATGS